MSLAFVPETRDFVRSAIAEAGGSEVFFGARLTADGLVGEVEVLARGDADEVPAALATLDFWDLVIHNHPGGDLRPSKPDLAVAALVAGRAKGFAIIDNEAGDSYVVVEPPRPESPRQVDPRVVEDFFAADGPLSEAVAGAYEPRSGQLTMALAVTDALNAGRVLAVEAGTGSGKSFAYLVPSILYGTANRTRVIVATGTINLQEQLTQKDLPILARAFETAGLGPFRFSHIKGRANYVCVRRAEELAQEAAQLEFEAERNREAETLRAILAWSRTTEDGSLSDLPFQPDRDVWERVASDGDRCLGIHCDDFKRCFYSRARFQASHSTILVVNHHLFFADFAIRQESGDFSTTHVLPPWRCVVFDEAHDLEEAASSFFGVTLTEKGIARRLGRLRSVKEGNRGILPALCAKLMAASETATVAELQGALFPLLEAAREEVGELFALVATRGGEAAIGTAEGAGSLRYRGESEPWGEIFGAARAAAAAVRAAKQAARRAGEPILQRVEEDESLRPAATELGAVCRRLEKLEEELEFFADDKEPEHVHWIELRGTSGPHLKTAPFLVGPLLAEGLWRAGPTCVLTSATLSVDGKIDYLAERLGFDGLPERRFRFVTVPSSFAWHEQAVFLIPSDGSEVTTDAFHHELARWIVQVARITRGRAFVLFTSYGMLDRAHEATSAELEAFGLEPLRQGSMPRSRLLDAFKRSGRAVLFGTESFWQGVDVPGEALSCVIIARLPFAVPTEPLQVARMEEVKSRGGDPFRSFSLPQAVLKLRQGAGRLIRSRTDRGAILVLDRRIGAKSYGKTFLRSLPPFRFVQGSREEILDELERFFGGLAS